MSELATKGTLRVIRIVIEIPKCQGNPITLVRTIVAPDMGRPEGLLAQICTDQLDKLATALLKSLKAEYLEVQ